MPEIIIYNTLKSILQIVKEDFINAEDEKNTILYNFFGVDFNDNRLIFESFNYFEQAKELFVKRSVSVNIGYNLETAPLGCVHILLPNENGRDLNIGADENYQPNIVETDSSGKSYYTPQYNSVYDATYNLMITSENTFQVLLIYNLFKAALVSIYYHLELSGLRLPKISGQDINLQSDLVPTHIFHRSLMLSFIYEISVPDFFRRKIISNFTATAIIISNTNNNSQ